MRSRIDNFAGIDELTEIPSPAQTRRARGPDSITYDFARLAPQEMAAHALRHRRSGARSPKRARTSKGHG
eukprot:8393356-Pyramimonas_sp.AAC.1